MAAREATYELEELENGVYSLIIDAELIATFTDMLPDVNIEADNSLTGQRDGYEGFIDAVTAGVANLQTDDSEGACGVADDFVETDNNIGTLISSIEDRGYRRKITR